MPIYEIFGKYSENRIIYIQMIAAINYNTP